jgi:isocitrate dehydrogenase kinase/phosphatase|tara:strand:- start:27267 stop:27710 length:444 start_codon:yes stop_codon:yes gene_type:complete
MVDKAKKVKKKVNTKKKGDKAENELAKLLQDFDETLMIEKAPRTMKRIFIKGKPVYVSQRNDYWGLFDIMVKDTAGHTTWIQVKSNISHVSTALKKIKSKAEYFDGDSCVVYLRVARKGWVVYYLDEEKRFTDLKLHECEPFKITTD